MRYILCIALVVILPNFAYASGGFEQSDFIPRLINFALFIAVLWYFTFARIKAIFTNRKAHIASQLQEIQNKLHKTQKEKDEALKKLEESKKKAGNNPPYFFLSYLTTAYRLDFKIVRNHII